MIFRLFRTAPARLAAAGAVLFVCLACDRVPGTGDDQGPRVLELTHDTIHLEPGVRLIEVRLERRAGGEFEPASIAARQGDVVRFTAADRAGHALVFDGAALAADARAFLERTGQLRSPPLIDTGVAWVIRLDDAPTGAYTVRCTTHDAVGRLTVSAR